MVQKKYVFNYFSLGRIDIRMPSNDDITTEFELNPTASSSSDIRCTDTGNGIICEDARMNTVFNFKVIVNDVLSVSVPSIRTV